MLTGRSDSREIKWLSHIESAQVTRVNDNPFGQVSSGELVITGPLKVLHFRDKKLEAHPRSDILQNCPYSTDIFLDTHPSIDEQISNWNQQIMSILQYTAYPAIGAAPAGGRDVFFMPFRILDWDYNNWDYEVPLLQGLLLLPCCTETPGTYQRVGLLAVSAHAQRATFEGGIWPFQAKTRILDSRLYQSIWSNGDCTVRIV